MLTAAEVDQFRVIDTDTHVIEPYDLWTSRLPSRWQDKAPHVKWDESRQEDAWYFGTERIGAAASAAQAGWREYPPDHPPRLTDVDVATWEPTARLARMDEYGVWAQVLYPERGRLRRREAAHARRRRADAGLRAGLQRLPRRIRVGRSTALRADHGAADVGHGPVREGDRPGCGPRPQRRDHDRRADLLGPAADRRVLLGPAVGDLPGDAAGSQLPHRLRRHVDLRPCVRRVPGRTPTTPDSGCSSAWPTPA